MAQMKFDKMYQALGAQLIPTDSMNPLFVLTF